MAKTKLTKHEKRILREAKEKSKADKKRQKQASGSDLRAVSRTVAARPGNGSAPAQTSAPASTSTATTNLPPSRPSSPHPSSPPPSSSPRDSPARPSPTPNKRNADQAGLTDEPRDKRRDNRRVELRQIIKAMKRDAGQRKTSKSIKKYKRKARMVPRLIHPFMDPYEVLMFGRAYKGVTVMVPDDSDEDDDGDEDTDSDDEDSDSDEDGDVEQEDEEEDDDDTSESKDKRKKDARAAKRAHKTEMIYQYNAILDLIPNLRTDIELLDDAQVEVLAKYIKHQAGKARATDTAHLVERVIQYIPVAQGDMDEQPYPSTVVKARRGYHEYFTARELVPPNLLQNFSESDLWKVLLKRILGNKIHLTAADYPSFLFDLNLSFYNADANVLDGLLRGLLFLMAVKSLWTGPLSSQILGGRKVKTPGKPPIAVANNISKITPRILAYTAVQLRHSMTAGSWNVMDLDFDNSDFFDRIVCLFAEPMSDWAKDLLDWWQMQVFGNMSRSHAKNLTRGRTTIEDTIQKALKDRCDTTKSTKSRTRETPNSSSSPARSPSPRPKHVDGEVREDDRDASMEIDADERGDQKDASDNLDAEPAQAAASPSSSD